jgi:hypothetical protein
MWRCVELGLTDVSEERIASIFRVEWSASGEQVWAVTALKASNLTIISRILGCNYRRGMDWILDILTTCIHHSELNFTDHWHTHTHTQTSVLGLLHSPLAVSWQRLLPNRFFSFPLSVPRVTAAHAELLSTQLTVSQAGGHFTPTS